MIFILLSQFLPSLYKNMLLELETELSSFSILCIMHGGEMIEP